LAHVGLLSEVASCKRCLPNRYYAELTWGVEQFIRKPTYQKRFQKVAAERTFPEVDYRVLGRGGDCRSPDRPGFRNLIQQDVRSHSFILPTNGQASYSVVRFKRMPKAFGGGDHFAGLPMPAWISLPLFSGPDNASTSYYTPPR